MLNELFNIGNYSFSFWSIPPLLMSTYFIAMGIFVYAKNSRSRVNLVFLLFCITTFWWQFSWFILFNNKNDDAATMMVKLGYTGINFIGPTLLHFVVEQFEFKKMRAYVYMCYLLAFIMLAVLWATDLYISGFYKYFWGYYPKAGILHLAHLTVQLGVSMTPAYALLIIALFKYKNNYVKRNQAKYVLAAFLIYFTAAADYIVNWGVEFYPFGVVFGIITASIIAFTIIRYRLMEIDTVIHRTLLWFITSLLLMFPLALIFLFGRPWINRFSWWSLTVFAIVLFYIFLSYYKSIQPKIDHIFRRRKYDYYSVLANVVSSLGSVLDLDKIFTRLFNELRNILYIKNAVIFIQNIGTEDYEERIRFGMEKGKGSVLKHGSVLSSWINKSKSALEKDRVAIEPQYAGIKDEAVDFFNDNSIEVFIPIVLGEKVIGFIGLGKKENLQHYTIKDVELLENMGRQMGISIENSRLSDNLKDKERIKKEMEIATTIQTAIAPPLPEHDELDIAAMMKPAEEVGGDYYDITFDRDKNLWFAIGDVSGHGVTPGLIMMMAETSLSTSLKEKSGITPREAIMAVNKVLCENIRTRLKSSYFMTMSFLKYAGKGDFVHSGAHLDILIYRSRSKTIERVKTEGIFLGIVPDIEKAAFESKFRLEKDDVMILYTDGITESRNKENRKELLGLERLQKIIMKYGDKGVEEIRDRILGHTLEWCGGKQDDDMTFMVVKRKK